MEINPGQLEALHQTFAGLELPWIPSVPESDDWLPYQLLPCEMFFTALNTANEVAKGNRFLDIGCGIGTVLRMAHVIGYEVSGFDIVPEYIEKAEQLVPEADLKVANLFDEMTFDADIILMCHPCRTEDKEREAEAHVIANSEPGTVIITPGADQPAGTQYIDGYVNVVL